MSGDAVLHAVLGAIAVMGWGMALANVVPQKYDRALIVTIVVSAAVAIGLTVGLFIDWLFPR